MRTIRNLAFKASLTLNVVTVLVGAIVLLDRFKVGNLDGNLFFIRSIAKNYFDTPEKIDEFWARRIKAGGFILHFRHFTREREPDVLVFDQVLMATDRELETSFWDKFVCLNEIGVAEATAIHSIVKLSNIGIGTVVSSPLCRSRQSAQLVAGRVDFYWSSLIHRTAIPPSQHREFALQLLKDLNSLPMEPGKNVMLFGHGGTLAYDSPILFYENRFGARVDERDMGGVAVIERVGEKYIVRHVFSDIKNFSQSLLNADAAKFR
jgi:phosphohistidine phosphatase SixA